MPAGDPEAPTAAGTAGSEGGQLSAGAQKGLDAVIELLNKLRAVDTARVFHEPVVGVPGYEDKIKRPMSFRVMETKLRAREYRSWRAFLADFELICSNAKTFNAPTTVVYKLAGNLQRAGRKILGAEELVGRRALYELHPQGPRAAALEEDSEILKGFTDDAATRSSLGLDICAAAAPAAAAAATGDGAAAAAAGSGGEQGGVPLPPDEPAAAAVRLWDPAAIELPTPNDWGLLFREAPDPSLDSVLQAARAAAALLPYGVAPGGGQQQGTRQGQQQQQGKQQEAAAAGAVQVKTEPGTCEGQQQGPAGPLAAAAAAGTHSQQQHEGGQRAQQVPRPPRLERSGRTAEWRAARRPLEWRARWLELRLREIGSLIAAIKAASCEASRSGEASTAAAAAAAAAAAGGKSSEGGAAAGAGGGGGGGSGADAPGLGAQAQTGGVLLPQHTAAFDAAALLSSTPFFALHTAPPGVAASQASSKQQQQQQQQRVPQQQRQQQEGEEAAGEEAGAPPAGFDLSDWQTQPGALYAAVEVVERNLSDMRLRVAGAFGIDAPRAPAGVRLGPYATAYLGLRRGGAGDARGARGGGGKGARAGGGGSAARPSRPAPAREGSGSLKRRRSGAVQYRDDDSSEEDDFLSSPTAAPRLLERQVSNIHIPPVRELPSEQLRARRVAMTAWNAAFSQHGAPALERVPPDVARAIAAFAEESSGDEDSGDEHYAALHAVMAAEEAARLSGLAGTGAQRGRRQAAATAGKDAGAGGSEGGDGGNGGQQQQQNQRRGGAPEKRGAPPKVAPPAKPSPAAAAADEPPAAGPSPRAAAAAAAAAGAPPSKRGASGSPGPSGGTPSAPSTRAALAAAAASQPQPARSTRGQQQPKPAGARPRRT